MNNTPHIFNQHQPRMNFIGIDLETTGLDLSRDRIVQFAAVCKGLESFSLKTSSSATVFDSTIGRCFKRSLRSWGTSDPHP